MFTSFKLSCVALRRLSMKMFSKCLNVEKRQGAGRGPGDRGMISLVRLRVNLLSFLLSSFYCGMAVAGLRYQLKKENLLLTQTAYTVYYSTHTLVV